MLLHVGAKLLGGDLFVVLGGDDDGVDALRLAVHIFHADLALPVRTKIAKLAEAPDLAQLPHQLVRQHDRQRHQLFTLVAGVAEHQALVSGAAGIDPHGDIRRLGLHHIEHAASLCVEAHTGVGKANIGDYLTGNLRNVKDGGSGDLSRHDADAGGHQRFAGHPSRRVVR